MKVVVASSEPRQRSALEAAVGRASNASLVATVSDLSAAYTVCEHKVPNFVLMAIEFTKLPEFEVLATLFKALKIRCDLVVTGPQVSTRDKVQAARYGMRCADQDDVAAAIQNNSAPRATQLRSDARPVSGSGDECFDDGFVLLGASTGGVDALIQVLSTFPKNCPPALIVQHTGAAFTTGLARLIDGHVPPAVSEGYSGATPKGGHVFLAPGGNRHMVIQKSAHAGVQLQNNTGAGGHCPSVDQLFLSAVPHAKRTVAALLTGMGRDGAVGLLALRQAGAHTIAQDQRTSIVYGMPRAAMDLYAASQQLPLDRIGAALLNARRKQHA